MEALLSHLLKSHILMIIFYLIYRFLLARQPWFQMNRFILLLLPALALTIPFLKFEIGYAFNPSDVIELTSAQLPAFEISATATSESGIN